MKLTQWVFFIDMLGYGNKNSKINNDELADKFIAFMQANAEIFNVQNSEEAKEKYKSQSVFNLYAYYDIQVTFVSDSLIINFKPKECEKELEKEIQGAIDNLGLDRKQRRVLIAKLKKEEASKKNLLIGRHSANALITITHRLSDFLRHCLEQEKIFVRGGISNEYCKIVNQFAVGEGVIEAYRTESEIAIEPRICLGASVLENSELIKEISLLSNEMYSSDILKEDPEDGVTYLDYLAFQIDPLKLPNHHQNLFSIALCLNFVKSHKKAIEYNLDILKDKNDDHNVKSKYLWLKKYHNETLLERIENKGLILRDPMKDLAFKKTLESHLIE